MEAPRRGQNQRQGVKTTGAIRETLLLVSSHRTTQDQSIGNKLTITFVFKNALKYTCVFKCMSVLAYGLCLCLSPLFYKINLFA